MSACTCAGALLRGWISRFGIPCHITSDRGAQFTSALWAALGQILGITLHQTAAYHPQANGMVERLHRSLKTILRAKLSGAGWMEDLPIALLALRTTFKEDLQLSAAELVYSQQLHLPADPLQ